MSVHPMTVSFSFDPENTESISHARAIVEAIENKKNRSVTVTVAAMGNRMEGPAPKTTESSFLDPVAPKKRGPGRPPKAAPVPTIVDEDPLGLGDVESVNEFAGEVGLSFPEQEEEISEISVGDCATDEDPLGLGLDEEEAPAPKAAPTKKAAPASPPAKALTIQNVVEAARGYAGRHGTDATKALLKKLGVKSIHDVKAPDFGKAIKVLSA